jgi:hypothetical protein
MKQSELEKEIREILRGYAGLLGAYIQDNNTGNLGGTQSPEQYTSNTYWKVIEDWHNQKVAEEVNKVLETLASKLTADKFYEAGGFEDYTHCRRSAAVVLGVISELRQYGKEEA